MRKKWTEKEIPDLRGKVALVTGGNIGLGFESVKMLAANGAEVILASRNLEKGSKARGKIVTIYPKAKIEALHLDLASLVSVKAFAQKILAKYNRLDILLNNAGIMMGPNGKTADGFERQFGTNHLGHFALTGHLIYLLKNTPDSRIVNISSRAHLYGEIDFDDVMWERKYYDTKAAYGQSKIANLYFTYELQRRIELANLSMESLAAHPGRSNTNLVKNMGSKITVFLVKTFLMPILTQSAKVGALAGIRAAVDPNAKGGEYYGPAGKNGKKGYPIKVDSNALSHDAEIAEKFWKLSEELTGVKIKL